MNLQEALERFLEEHRKAEAHYKELSANEVVEQCAALSDALFDVTGFEGPARGSDGEADMLAALGGRILLLLVGKR